MRALTSIVVFALATTFPDVAIAQGTLGFTTTHTTIQSGEPFSSLENGLDWVSPNPTATINGSVIVASPNAQQHAQIESWRQPGTGGAPDALRLTFTIEDQSRQTVCPPGAGQPPCTAGSTLDSGDKIVIEIDPTTNPGVTQKAALTGSERRFEITINPTAGTPIVAGVSVPSGNTWSTTTSVSIATLNTTTYPGTGVPAYLVDVTLTYGGSSTNIGSAISGNFGIAIAIVNDLGHSHGVDFNGDPCTPYGTGNCTVPSVEMTGIAFPSSMGLDASSDPLIFGSVDSGNWVVPGAWGIGSWAGGTPNISLSHHQQYVWSDSIRISVCSTTSFNDTPATTPWGDQLNLTNWYQYYPDNPCKMKVWVQVFNTGGTANQRLLVIWGRPNIGGTADWFVVGLSGSVAIANPSSTSFILWDDPPPQNFTDHPCLRVYVLPDSLPQSWVTKLTTPNIAIPPSTTNNAVKLDESDRTALEMQFGLTGESWLTAQMNFTAIRTGICQTPGCNSLTALSRPVTWLAEWLRNPRAPAAEMRTGAGAFAQPQRGREIPKPVAFPGPDFKISAIGIGFSRASVRSKPSHTYLTNIGGIAWAVPINEMQASKQRGTRIDVQNPRVLAPGRGNVKPIESPPRIVMLDTIVRSTEKRPWWWFFGRQTPLPVVRIDAPSRPLKPGETVPVTLTFVAR